MVSGLRFSANLGFLWADLPLLERIERAAQAGFRGIEMHWPYDADPVAVARLCKRLDLTILSINTPQGATAGDAGLAAQPGREGEFEHTFEQTLQWAVESSATMIHVLPGRRQTVDLGQPSGLPSSEDVMNLAGASCFIRNLRWASDRAMAHGKVLLLEAINGRDKPGYFYHTQEASHAILKACDKPNIRMMFDVYHVGIAQGDVLRRLTRFLPDIGHIQIAGVPDRNEPDDGEIDYRKIFDALSRMRYSGWVGCEYRPAGNLEQGLARWTRECGVAL